MTDRSAELHRIEAFLTDFHERMSERVVEWRAGTAYLHDGLPKVWDLNLMRLEERGLSAHEIAVEADEVMGGTGCEHRRVWVADAEWGAELEPGFKELGWETDVHLAMGHHREPDRIVDTFEVEDVGAGTWSAREEQLRSYPWVDDEETLVQMRGLYDLMTEVGNARDFAIMRNGKAISFALLFSDGSTGQIEDVATLEEFRNLGLSRQVVTRALEESRARHDYTFLIADDRDWPKDFYSKLGFDEVGRHYYFLKTPPHEKRPA